LTAAIALKTRSPVLSSTAFMPLVGPAYLAFTLRKDHKPENTIDRVALDSEKATIEDNLPTFKHGLLNYDWAPELHIGKLDRKMFKTSKEKFSGIYELIYNADEAEMLRREEAKAMRAEAKAKRAEAKAKKRKARDEENEKARDKDRARKMDHRDKRTKMKYDRQKRAEEGKEEKKGPERPGEKRQPEWRVRPERRKR